MLASLHDATAACLIPSMLSVAKLLGKKETCDGTTTQFEEVDQEWDHLKHTNSQAALLCSALLCSALLCRLSL